MMYLGVCKTSWEYRVGGIQGVVKDTSDRYQYEHCGQVYDFLTPALKPFDCQSKACHGRRREVSISEQTVAVAI
jgi:hypothetical protein